MNTSTTAAQQQGPTFNPIVMHTIRSWQMIDDYVLNGQPVTALCGEQWTPDNLDDTADGTTVDCPLCGVVYSGMLSRRREPQV
ncbi:DUF3039 domain-containing protein [Arthrobacter sp. MDT3-44]